MRPLLARLAVVTAVLLVVLAVWSGAAATRASAATTAGLAATSTVPDLINDRALEASPDDPLTGLPSPAGIYHATPDQTASLQRLEQQAVTDTITDHELTGADANAVASWGRSDADAEL